MSKTDELLKLKELLERGGITQDEYEKEKSKLISPKTESDKLTLSAYIVISLVFIICIGIIFSFFGRKSNVTEEFHEKQPNVKNSTQNKFENEFRISVSASL